MMTNVLEYLESAKERCPEKIAFSDGKSHLSFYELWDFSKRVGVGILSLETGTVRRKPIVVFMEKSPQMLTAFFGTVYSGNFYVPLDKEMPSSRISLIFQDLQPELVIVDEKTEKLAQSFCEETTKIKLISDLWKREVTHEQDCQLEEIRESTLDIDPLYLIFTSGSTGKPKGVLANHRSVIDYVEQLSQVLAIDEDTVFGNQAPLYVDACLKEIFPTLKHCATTYMIPKTLFMFPVKLIDFLNENKINTICWVVTALSIVSSFGGLGEKKIEHLRTLAFGSEVFPRKDFLLWRAHLPEAKFFHLYGPTEATGMSTYYEVAGELGENEPIPIGKAFQNSEVFLLDEEDKRISPQTDSVGEICIRGTCLSMGYYGDFQQTASVFVQNPEVTAYTDLIYRTGDLGCYNHLGELVYLSRKDYQIKHLGHRIELGEIEVACGMISAVKQACCVYQQEKKALILHFVGDIEEKEVLAELKKLLPRYMVPSRIQKRNDLPLTLNGKIDRNFLLNEA